MVEETTAGMRRERGGAREGQERREKAVEREGERREEDDSAREASVAATALLPRPRARCDSCATDREPRTHIPHFGRYRPPLSPVVVGGSPKESLPVARASFRMPCLMTSVRRRALSARARGTAS